MKGINTLAMTIANRKYKLLILALILIGCTESGDNNSTNLTRVETAFQEKEKLLRQLLEERQLKLEELNLFIRAFKKERQLEIWGKNSPDKTYKKITTYQFCRFSGQLGPKKKEGDRQIPEGAYQVDRFNPKSNYYLSLGLNYPNKSDRIRGDQHKPGSDIFIHGGCGTIGCIPITNDKIKELYVLAHSCRENGQEAIPVNIYPTKMTESNIQEIIKEKPEHEQLWLELKELYDNFEKTKEIPEIEINELGAYQIK